MLSSSDLLSESIFSRIIHRIFLRFGEIHHKIGKFLADDSGENAFRAAFAFIVAYVGKNDTVGIRCEVVIFEVGCDEDVGAGAEGVGNQRRTGTAAKGHTLHHQPRAVRGIAQALDAKLFLHHAEELEARRRHHIANHAEAGRGVTEADGAP